jgi:hypothetical protein
MQRIPSKCPLALETKHLELVGYNPAYYISSVSHPNALIGTHGEVRQDSFVRRRHTPAEALSGISSRIHEIST